MLELGAGDQAAPPSFHLLHPHVFGAPASSHAYQQGTEMTVEILFPLLKLSHTARDAEKVFKYFEALLETDTPRQGWAYAAVRTADAVVFARGGDFS